MTWHILVVDDEPLNLEIIGESLDDTEYRLSFAENGEIAWSVLTAAEVQVDLIILDRMMPVLDGLSLLKRIKADERYAAVPVIMQTAASAPEEVREGIEAGAYYYLPKPYELDALHTIVRAALADVAKWRGSEIASHRRDEVLAMASRAEFDFRSLEQASQLAGALAALCPDPGPVALGLNELLVNAVEHGNLGITYVEKKRLRQNDGWNEEIVRRLALPEYRNRVARVRVSRTESELVFTVEDQGDGFDCRSYLEFDPDRAYDPNGRGIAMARQVSFCRLDYRGCGNVVEAAVSLKPAPAPAAESN